MSANRLTPCRNNVNRYYVFLCVLCVLCGEKQMLPLIPILHLDEALLVINKPSRLHTLPDGYDAALPHVRSLLEPEYGRLWIVHRLDRETSGVLALARSAEAHRHLNTQFAEHTIRKIYHALVLGAPEWKEHTVSLPLSADRGRRHRTVEDPRRGKPAITHLRVLARYASYTLIELHLRPGAPPDPPTWRRWSCPSPWMRCMATACQFAAPTPSRRCCPARSPSRLCWSTWRCTRVP
jgi:23S rRNA-/tRNA-specific pseudouridylate synthase